MEKIFIIKNEEEYTNSLKKIDIFMNNENLSKEERIEFDKLVDAVIAYEDIYWKIELIDD